MGDYAQSRGCAFGLRSRGPEQAAYSGLARDLPPGKKPAGKGEIPFLPAFSLEIHIRPSALLLRGSRRRGDYAQRPR